MINKRSTQCQLLQLYTCTTTRGGSKEVSMDDACKLCFADDITSCYKRCALVHVAFYKTSQTTHARPIVSQFALRAVWEAHHY